MKNLIFALVALTVIGSSALGGTARQLSMSEQKVVAEALAQAIPSIVSGDQATLRDCQLGNMADQGKPAQFQITCEYTATATSFKADVIFDSVILRDDSIQSAQFLSLIRQ